MHMHMPLGRAPAPAPAHTHTHPDRPQYAPAVQPPLSQVMTLWVIAYIFIGQVAVPAVLSALDVERMELSMRGQAVLHLCLDIAQLAVTLITLRFCLHKYKPRQQGLFRVQWKGWWVLWVLAAALCFPAVDWLSTQSMVSGSMLAA